MGRPSFKAKAVFEAILEAILTPPGASKIDKKSFQIYAKIEAFFERRFEAIWKPPGRLLGSILGGFWARFWSPGRVMLFSTKIAPRYSESTIFRGSRGPKMNQNGGQNCFQRQPGSKSVLEGSWARFWLDVGLHVGV